MCLRLFLTASRGRSAVPLTFDRIRLRMRSRLMRRSFALSIFSPKSCVLSPESHRPSQDSGLGTQDSFTGRLAGLATNDFVAVLDALALVRIGLAERADLRCRLPHLLLVDPGHRDVAGLAIDRDIDALRNREAHRVRISELEHHFLRLHFSAKSNADDVELFLEALRDAEDVVGDEGAHETVNGAGLPFVIFARERHDVVLDFHADAGDDRRHEHPFGALDRDTFPVLLDFHAFRHGNRLVTNARHGTFSLPDLTEDLAADAALLGFVSGEHTPGRRHDTQSGSAADA